MINTHVISKYILDATHNIIPGKYSEILYKLIRDFMGVRNLNIPISVLLTPKHKGGIGLVKEYAACSMSLSTLHRMNNSEQLCREKKQKKNVLWWKKQFL